MTLPAELGIKRAPSLRTRLLSWCLLILATLFLLEAALWFADHNSKTVHNILSPQSPMLQDPMLGVRLNPAFPGHDADGFRNRSAPGPSMVVALGDSQTYGDGVPRDDAWPQILSQMSGKSVYNMGVPSYGPVQSLMLMPRALQHQPRIIVEALYAGNDLLDAYEWVYVGNQMLDLKSTDHAVLDAIAKADRLNPLGAEILRAREIYLGNFEPSQPSPGPAPPTSSQPTAQQSSLVMFLRRNTKLWRVVRAARSVIDAQAESGSNAIEDRISKSNGQWIPFQKRGIQAIFVPAYRFPALDMGDPRIKEGLRISIEATSRMSEMAKAANAQFAVVLLPTKESVFYAQFAGDLPGLEPLAQAEQQMRTQLENELKTQGISFIDALPALRKALALGESPYLAGTNGHPNSSGHWAIAEAVQHALPDLR